MDKKEQAYYPTKSDIRKAFKDLGVKVSIVHHMLIDNGLTLKSKDFPFSGNCFSGQFIKDNQSIFDYWNSIKGAVLDTGEKLI